MYILLLKKFKNNCFSDIFIKVHKSFCVDINKVKSIEGNILNIGNAKITISQNLREKVSE